MSNCELIRGSFGKSEIYEASLVGSNPRKVMRAAAHDSRSLAGKFDNSVMQQATNSLCDEGQYNDLVRHRPHRYRPEVLLFNKVDGGTMALNHNGGIFPTSNSFATGMPPV